MTVVWFVFCKNCMRFVDKIVDVVPYKYKCPFCGATAIPAHRRKINDDLTELPIITYVYRTSQAYYKLKEMERLSHG